MKTEQEILRDAVLKIRQFHRPLITVDGPCASGKTTFSSMLAGILDAAVIHTDDYVIPHSMKTTERLAVPGGNCDGERLCREVIAPWRGGLPVSVRRYACHADRLLEAEALPDCSALILEGSYSNLPEIREAADMRFFLDTAPEVREARLRERESPESLQMFYEKWIPLENAYFAFYGLPDAGCVVLTEPLKVDDFSEIME